MFYLTKPSFLEYIDSSPNRRKCPTLVGIENIHSSCSVTTASPPKRHRPNVTAIYSAENLDTSVSSPSVFGGNQQESPNAFNATLPFVHCLQHSASALQVYAHYLKEMYLNMTTPVYDKECSLIHRKTKSFINIALVHKDSGTYSDRNEMLMDKLHGHVDTIQRKKTDLQVNDVCVCENGRVARSVLVEGAPGTGKTTFVFELCRRWARGEVLQKYNIVLVIKLRDHRVRTAESFNQLLYHPDPALLAKAVDQLVCSNGDTMLLILDGYDELTDSQKNKCTDSVIQHLMRKELFFLATLLVTSRPLASQTLHLNFLQSIDQHIEVLGYTERNIEEYIDSVCENEQTLLSDFKSYLSSHPFSNSLMFNPLQCAIVTDTYCYHWRNGDKGFAPKTLTELYTGLVHTLLIRHFMQQSIQIRRIRDFNELPENLRQKFRAIISLASEGIENQQYVFDEDDDNVPSETLGLMQREEDMTPGIGISGSHMFLHLTLQEYLSAVNYCYCCDSPRDLSKLLTRNDLFPLKSFFKHYGKTRKQTTVSSATHWPVVLFIAGRTKLRGVSHGELKQGLHRSHEDTSVDLALLHLLYETQSPELIQSTLIKDYSSKYLLVSGRSSLDWYVIGYCIANSCNEWKVKKIGTDNHKFFQQLVTGLKLGVNGESNIGSLDITDSSSANICNILLLLHPYSKAITEMKLTCLKRKVYHGSKQELSFQCYPKLRELKIANIDFTNLSLIRFISYQLELGILFLSECKISSEAMKLLAQFLQSSECKVHQVTIEKCTSGESVSAMFTASFEQQLTCTRGRLSRVFQVSNLSCCWLSYFCHDTRLTELTFEYSKDECNEIVTGQEVHLQFSHLEKLTISNDHSFPLTFSLLESQKINLYSLSLRKCILSSQSTSSLIQTLQSSCCKLQKVIIYCCSVPTAYYVDLSKAISSNITIKRLLFIDANINSLLLTVLTEELKQNTVLEELAIECSVKDFTEDQIRLLREAVDGSIVKTLWLRKSYEQFIHEEGFRPFSRDVTVKWYHTLKELDEKWK